MKLISGYEPSALRCVCLDVHARRDPDAGVFMSVVEYMVLILALLLLWIFVVYPMAVGIFYPNLAKPSARRPKSKCCFHCRPQARMRRLFLDCAYL